MIRMLGVIVALLVSIPMHAGQKTLTVSPTYAEFYSGTSATFTFTGCGNKPGAEVYLIIQGDPTPLPTTTRFPGPALAGADGCFTLEVHWNLGGYYKACYAKSGAGFKPGCQGVSAAFEAEYEYIQ